MESDMSITANTISDAEMHLAKIEKQLRVTLAMPEREIDCGGDGRNDQLSATTGILATIRSKIKSAAYTGPGGVPFCLFAFPVGMWHGLVSYSQSQLVN